MGVSANKLEDTFNKYNEAAQSKKCPFGKKYFHNVPFKLNDFFHVAFVTPVLHFTMGGLEIDEFSHVLSSNGPVPGLFAAVRLFHSFDYAFKQRCFSNRSSVSIG
jgi:succinate dehydrogenase/fumarate reductase flavoprotein subunit